MHTERHYTQAHTYTQRYTYIHRDTHARTHTQTHFTQRYRHTFYIHILYRHTLRQTYSHICIIHRDTHRHIHYTYTLHIALRQTYSHIHIIHTERHTNIYTHMYIYTLYTNTHTYRHMHIDIIHTQTHMRVVHRHTCIIAGGEKKTDVVDRPPWDATLIPLCCLTECLTTNWWENDLLWFHSEAFSPLWQSSVYCGGGHMWQRLFHHGWQETENRNGWS